MMLFNAVAAIVIAQPLTWSQDDPNWFRLGETIAFGQTDPDSRKFAEMRIPIRFPKQLISTPTDFEPHIRWNEKKIQLNQWGNIGRIYQATGGWDEFRERWERAQDRIAQGESRVWKVRAQIFRRTDVLYKRSDGVLVPQRGYLSLQDVRFVAESFVRFEALVEAFTDGAVDVEITYGVEEEPVFGDYEGSQTWSFHPFVAAENYLRGRFNYGDYDSIIYFYPPGLTNSFSFGGTIGRSNNATLSYVILTNGREQDTRIGHTEALLHEWLHQVENTWSKFGYGMQEGSHLADLHSAEAHGFQTDIVGYTGWFAWIRDFMTYNVSQGMWAKLTNRDEPNWEEVLKVSQKWDGSVRVWSDVADDPWAKLPYLTASDLSRRIGATSMEILVGDSELLFVPTGGSTRGPMLTAISPGEHSLNNQLSFGREAIARIGYGDRDLVFVRFDAADFVFAHLGDPAEASILGYMGVGGKLVVVADVKLDNPSTAEVNILRLGTQSTPIAVRGGGDTRRSDVPRVEVSSSRADLQFRITDWSGVQITQGAGGSLELGRDAKGTYILKATSALPDGTRVERPFVVRMVDPVAIEMEAVGTRKMTGKELPIEVHMTNGGENTIASIAATLPTGWTLSGVSERVELSANERRTIKGSVIAPDDAQDGPATIALDVIVQSYSGPIQTERLSIVRFTQPTLEHATFELTTRPGAGTDGWNTPRQDNGGWRARAIPGGFKGQCLQITDAGGTRWGRVNAFGGYLEDGKPDPEWLGYDVRDYPYLDFYLKTAYDDTLGLVVTLHDGRRFTIMLAGEYRAQWGESVQLPRAKFTPNGQWQRIVYDLGGELAKVIGSERIVIVDIGFGDTRQFSSNQQSDEDQRDHFVDEWRITREANLADNTIKEHPDADDRRTADAGSTDPAVRARVAAGLTDESPPEVRAAVRGLLKDRDPFVRVNAAAAFARVKDEGSTAALAETALMDPDQRAGIFAIEALALINTPVAHKGIETAVRSLRFEEHVLSKAALELGRIGNEEYITPIGNLLAAHSWMTRAAAVRALGLIPSQEAQRRALVFLMEVDPMVRLEVSRIIDPDLDPAARRMEWASVNDVSNVVRGYSFAALARSADPKTRELGYSGIRDEDPEIRKIIAAELGRDNKLHHLATLTVLLSDTVPDVRAAAVASMLGLPGERAWAEFASLSGEMFEQVLLPLLRAHEAGKINMPADVLRSLDSHPSAEVRTLAGRLGRSN